MIDSIDRYRFPVAFGDGYQLQLFNLCHRKSPDRLPHSTAAAAHKAIYNRLIRSVFHGSAKYFCFLIGLCLKIGHKVEHKIVYNNCLREMRMKALRRGKSSAI